MVQEYHAIRSKVETKSEPSHNEKCFRTLKTEKQNVTIQFSAFWLPFGMRYAYTESTKKE